MPGPYVSRTAAPAIPAEAKAHRQKSSSSQASLVPVTAVTER